MLITRLVQNEQRDGHACMTYMYIANYSYRVSIFVGGPLNATEPQLFRWVNGVCCSFSGKNANLVHSPVELMWVSEFSH